MNAKVRVLVFPCGAENAAEIHQALRHSVHVELYGASSVDDFGRFRFANYVGGLPNIRDDGFDAMFGALVARLGIDLVFATHDSVQEHLAGCAPRMGFHLVNGDPRSAAIARSKAATYALFADCPWSPEMYARLADVARWPIVVKPDKGQGGQGVACVHEPAAAAAALAATREPLLVEHLPGAEITVDCFTDRHRRLVWVGPRTRERVRAGITMRSTFVEPSPEITAIAATINERIALRGPWFFQLKRDRDERWKLLEVSCRVAGAMAAQRARGVNLPLMAVHDHLGRDVTAVPIREVRLVERNVATRAELAYEYDTVYVDLDDTLIVNDAANPPVLAFLYQSVAEGKAIRLITRHAKNPVDTLRRVRICPELFDEIIHLGTEGSKADHLRGRAIFIDNHFPERVAVMRGKGIPAFDVDALEFFIR